ncbi:hypothetical protein QR98_0032500 [Sarcoptes scabiei]|uniref:Uncharacterized protein n=1 Tax=Sarcoptes scabiei TaxID=52283 RepID=A0A132A157_SARSC|nr:hypothetical protein QR98_0032500 [Sarcoptes scabiei]
MVQKKFIQMRSKKNDSTKIFGPFVRIHSSLSFVLDFLFRRFGGSSSTFTFHLVPRKFIKTTID